MNHAVPNRQNITMEEEGQEAKAGIPPMAPDCMEASL
jgi:hypothetical protein